MPKKIRRTVKRRALSRRTFLGGAGVSVALPFLEAMTPQWAGVSGSRAKAAGDDAVRLMWIHVPNGMIRTNMTPNTAGRDYAMPRLLSSLEDIRDDFLVLSGLSNLPGGGRYTYPDGTVSNDGPGDHARDTGTFLTCARLKKTDGSDIRNGISIDQVAANYLREVTPSFPSLVTATRNGSYGGDSGYAPIYKSNISWRSETQPSDKETEPRNIFERLFAGFDATETLEQRERRLAREHSVLDAVLDDLHTLQPQLSSRDNEKLDEFLTGVRQLEVRIDESEGAAICDPGAVPGDPANFEERVDLLFDVITLAFQCDRTRVVTLDMEKGGAYDFLGIAQNHHQISHLEAGNPDVEKIERINEWQIRKYGELLRRLKNAEQGDGTNLLDHSLVMFGGGLDGTGHSGGATLGDLTPQQSGGVHRHTNLPVLLGGHGGGFVDSGRHVVYEDREPIADLYISMLHAIGHEVDSFALEGTGPLHSL